MPTARGTRSLHGMFRSACVLAACVLAACVLAACVLAACGLLALGPAWAQPSGVDETSGPAAPPDNSQGEIVPPGPPPATVVPAPVIAASAQAAPTVAAPTFPAPVPPAPTLATPAQTVSPPGQPPASPQLPPTTAVQQAPPVPLRLDQPRVIDTARLTAGDNSVSLFGIVGLPGELAQGLQGFLAASGNRVSCQAQPGGDFVCLLPDGTDVAAVALINGAARARADAPAAYREQEAAAQAARRGLWSSLPPPPVTLNHPTVKDTATLVAERQSYVLDGLQGLGAPYAGQLQGYVAANGDALICQQQPVSNAYICILKGGTDIAKVALVNGAALVSPDAPDLYRLQQREALNNQRGYWLHPPADAVLAARTIIEQPNPCCVFVAGDDGGDGIAYVGGAPTAIIEGETVFLVFAGALGWGYYDHWHHWRGVPDRYRGHLEHFHPEGHGLRGYGGGGQFDGPHPGAVHQTAMAGAAGHPGFAPGAHPGGNLGFAPGGHPGGNPGFASGAHPGGSPGFTAGAHPGGNPGFAPGAHPGGAPAGNPGFASGAHPGGMGSGFIRPTQTASGFHPGGMPQAAHSAPPSHTLFRTLAA